MDFQHKFRQRQKPACPLRLEHATEKPFQLGLLHPARRPLHDPCHDIQRTAYAYGNFHRDFVAGRTTVIACPKQREHDMAGKLTAIFRENDIKSITLCRMFVPCCGGLEYAVYQALAECGKKIPLRIVTIGADGKQLSVEKS